VVKSDDEWQSILTPEAFYVLREKGTEAPWSSELNALEGEGVLQCAGCSSPLFAVSSKFDSGTGWPSFTAPVSSDVIEYSVDFAAILPRTECLCRNCRGHLGHVFEDGPQPTGLRYCLNGVAMKYDESSTTTMQAQVDAARLPLESVLPNIVLNLGVAVLFAMSWIRHEHQGDGMVERFLENCPLLVGAFYGYSAVKSLRRLKL